MDKFVDIDLNKDAGYYDLSFTNGDFTKVAGFDTAILMSHMAERRASVSEIKPPQNRRGWWGNEANGFDNFEDGSKLWLLQQARATQKTLNDSRTYTQEALQWFVDDDHLNSIRVTAEYDSDMRLIINEEYVRKDNQVFSRSYNIWENTFIDGDA